MEFTFYKYQGTGNDFVIIDNRGDIFPKNNRNWIATICDRRLGVGADGLILLENHDTADFKMVYFNADGKFGSMCGNGGRCITHFAKFLGIIDVTASFEASDGMHTSSLAEGEVSLKMNDVRHINRLESGVFLDTGSPHHIELVEDLDDIDVKTIGAKIRYNTYGKEGANVNFVSQLDADNFGVRTYERGVEDETLSCGTGVTAVAIAMFELGKTKSNLIYLSTPGGDLRVEFEKNRNGYTNIFLIGAAKQVFKGIVNDNT